MAKKYLLYIHHPAFEVEKEKSSLVNKLLVEHYDVKSVGSVTYTKQAKTSIDIPGENRQPIPKSFSARKKK